MIAHSVTGVMLTSMLLACVKPFLQRKGLVGQPGGGLPSTILVFLVQDFVHATALPAMGVRAFFQSASDWVATFLPLPQCKPFTDVASDSDRRLSAGERAHIRPFRMAAGVGRASGHCG